MTATTPEVSEAFRIMSKLWGNRYNLASATAAKWFFSEGGAEAFMPFLFQMRRGPEELKPLAREVFALQVEIAARKAGWCPELPAQPMHAPESPELNTDYQ